VKNTFVTPSRWISVCPELVIVRSFEKPSAISYQLSTPSYPLAAVHRSSAES
jgi:hypothetical protein